MLNSLLSILNFGSNLKEILMVILAIALIALLAIFLLKVPKGGYILLGILLVGLITSGVFAAYADYEYFTSRSSIHGQIEDISNKNKVIQDGLTFNFEKFTLEASGNENEYKARIAIITIPNIDLKEMMVLVNNECTTFLTATKNYISVEFGQAFISEYEEEINSDYLKIQFVFNDVKSECIISTNGGLDKVKLWNSYIDKNGFKVEIVPSDFTSETSPIVSQSPRYSIYYHNEEKELLPELTQTFSKYTTKLKLNYPYLISTGTDEDGNLIYPYRDCKMVDENNNEITEFAYVEDDINIYFVNSLDLTLPHATLTYKIVFYNGDETIEIQEEFNTNTFKRLKGIKELIPNFDEVYEVSFGWYTSEEAFNSLRNAQQLESLQTGEENIIVYALIVKRNATDVPGYSDCILTFDVTIPSDISCAGMMKIEYTDSDGYCSVYTHLLKTEKYTLSGLKYGNYIVTFYMSQSVNALPKISLITTTENKTISKKIVIEKNAEYDELYNITVI